MNSKKTTKHALMSSVVALLLCCAMLIGTTFAWFTDSASTAVNKIQAGTLDVALEMYDGANWVSAEGKTLQFKVNGAIPAAGTQILWEPGCTYELPALRVVNKGTLALKYKVIITGIQGDARLNDAIDWTINDVWTANGKMGWAYNSLYDLYYQAGVPLTRQRVASPFISEAIPMLHIYRAIDPDTWGKMISRVNGVNFAGMYGTSTAMGWRSIKCPKGFSWERYMEFLLSTLPTHIRHNYEEKLRVSKKLWRERGGCLAPVTKERELKKAIQEKYKSPVYNVIAVPIEKVKANDYNPNIVAPPEMKLLELSIWEDGYTMPCVLLRQRYRHLRTCRRISPIYGDEDLEACAGA